MLDISDGLSTDLAHICEESGVGAEIMERAIPRSRIGSSRRQVDLPSALHGGEDYELLFTSRASIPVPRRIAGVEITEIGRVTRGSHLMLKDAIGKESKLRPGGWEHFRKSR
jgi:thiamine-monophosphate kinase